MEHKKINRILIPVDFSETGLLALEHAAFMAYLFQADLYLLHVIELLHFPFNLNLPLLLVPNNYEEIEKEVVVKLDELAKQINQKHNVHIIQLISKSRVISGIIDAAKDNHIDVIVMGTHGVKGFDEYFIGSNAHKTVTISPCPVITIQHRIKNIGFKNIVMPIDNSLHSREKVDMVIELASKYGAMVHILGLINTVENIEEKKFNIKLDAVEKFIVTANILYSKEIVRGKNLAVESMNYSEKINADLIVIMTDHESDLTGMFLGGFSKQIINHSTIPVMSIRPTEGHYEELDLRGIANPFTEI